MLPPIPTFHRLSHLAPLLLERLSEIERLRRRPFVVLIGTCLILLSASNARAAKIDVLNQSLMEAAEKGDEALVKSLLDQGADPNARVLGTPDNCTPLHLAVGNNHRETAALLLNYGADPYLEDDHHDTVLFPAAFKENETILKLLLEWKVPIDFKNSEGTTVLMRRVTSNSAESAAEVQLLLDCGADPNQRSQFEYTPLMNAVSNESDAIAKILIKAGAEVNARNVIGNSVLMCCAGGTYHGSMKALIDAGANVNLPNKDGETPLMNVIGSREGLERLLLDHGADVTARKKDGTTILMIAANRGSVDILKLAIAHGVDANAQTVNGETALQNAVMFARNPYEDMTEAKERETPLQMIALLLQAGADAKKADAEGMTPLHFACGNGYSGTVRLLLEKGLNPNVASKKGLTPLHLAVSSRFAYGASGDAEDKVKLLFSKGAAVDAADKEGRTPLWISVTQMDSQLVALLLENGASADITDKAGDPLLCNAARSFHERYVQPKGYSTILKALAAKAKNPDLRDSRAMTPLMWAAAADSPSSVDALLARNPDLNARSADGRTPLMWAAATGATHTIDILRRHGADMTAKDSGGRTAADWAKWMNQKNALTLLGSEKQ